MVVATRYRQHLVRPFESTVATKPVPRERWAAFFEEQGTAPDRTGPRIGKLDGYNSGWIDFEGEGAEHVRGTRSFEEVFCQLIRRAG